jgi:hypothetical protein
VAERYPKRVTAPDLGPPTADIDVGSRDDEHAWL